MNWQSPKVAGLTSEQWRALARRVGNGMATADDARPVDAIGLNKQARRIRRGMATHTDSVLIHLQAQMRLLGIVEKSGTGQRAAS
jgi:hypothetical protein